MQQIDFKRAEGCIVLGLHHEKNGLTVEHPLDLQGKRELVIVDVDWLLSHIGEVLTAAKQYVDARDQHKRD